MVTAEHAREAPGAQRLADGAGQPAASAAHGELPAALRGKRRHHGADPHFGPRRLQTLDEQRRERSRRFRAAGVRAPEAPRCADDVDLSLHRYIRIRVPRPLDGWFEETR
jgi:hypothetical protein